MTNSASQPPRRHLPVRLNRDQLRRQAKELLAKAESGDALALLELSQVAKHGSPKLADAQHALAVSYGAPNWARIVLACQVSECIWQNRVHDLAELALKNPSLIHEPVRIQQDNWGPPLSYAANLGRDEIIKMLLGLGASDIQKAFDRASLQGRIETARFLIDQGAKPTRGCVMGPCETLNADGLRFLLEVGAGFCDVEGSNLAPLGLILQTYSRNPLGRAECLKLAERAGFPIPKSAPMELLKQDKPALEARLPREPDLLSQTFDHHDFYPLEAGCSEDQNLALHGAPLAGGTLLHLAVDNGDYGMVEWLLEKGADPNTPAANDSQGFGGHTALYGAVVSQLYRVGQDKDGRMARILLEHGASLDVRANLRKSLRFVEDETEHRYLNVTPFEFGTQFHDQDWVNPLVLKLITP